MDKHAILCILISLWVVDILLCIVLYVGTKEVLMSDTDATQARQDVVADVDEILEHVINGNMLSMPYDVYLELFDAVDGLGVEIEKLQDDNAKLRTAISAVLQCSGITKRDKGCDACPMYDREKEYVWAGDWCGIKRFIRELGIEVDA